MRCHLGELSPSRTNDISVKVSVPSLQINVMDAALTIHEHCFSHVIGIVARNNVVHDQEMSSSI